MVHDDPVDLALRVAGHSEHFAPVPAGQNLVLVTAEQADLAPVDPGLEGALTAADGVDLAGLLVSESGVHAGHGHGFLLGSRM
ncbi:hypothetical protein [Streptomyces sp. NPDC001450]